MSASNLPGFFLPLPTFVLSTGLLTFSGARLGGLGFASRSALRFALAFRRLATLASAALCSLRAFSSGVMAARAAARFFAA